MIDYEVCSYFVNVVFDRTKSMLIFFKFIKKKCREIEIDWLENREFPMDIAKHKSDFVRNK